MTRKVEFKPSATDHCLFFKGKEVHYLYHEEEFPVMVYYEFENLEESKKFMSQRTIENYKAKFIEDYMAADNQGNFDIIKFYKLVKSTGLKPEPPCSLTDLRAIQEVFGFEIDEDLIVDYILKNIEDKANKIKESKRRNVAQVRVIPSDAKKQLCKRFNLPDHMADLFLSEIKNKYTKGVEDEETLAARLLGLI